MDELAGHAEPAGGRICRARGRKRAFGRGRLSEEEAELEADETAHHPTAKKPLQIAVIGGPECREITLINKIIGQERLLTGPEAGITRDAISVPGVFMGTPIRIFDTAGMRKKAKVVAKLEKLSVADGLRAVRFAEVVVVLLDVDIPFEQQDLRIADYAETEGRAVVIAVNKWDLEDEKVQAGRSERDVRAVVAAAARGSFGDGRPRPAGAWTVCTTPSVAHMTSGTSASPRRG
jgi:small GTP-binding protein